MWVSLIYSGCGLWYHHNFIVNAKSDTRTFYANMPSIIEVTDHAFMTQELVVAQTNMMNISWYVLLCVFNVSLRVNIHGCPLLQDFSHKLR